MAAMAPLTVKKYDGTTDIIYAAIAPSNGDGTDAIWRQDAANANPYALRPTIKMRVRSSADKKARNAEINAFYPALVTDTTTSLVTSNGGVRLKLFVSVDQHVTIGACLEGSAQLLNALSTTLIKTAVSEGYAPQG